MDAVLAPVPDRRSQLVLASWPAFLRAVTELTPLPVNGHVDLGALTVAPSSRKQIVAALRLLRLIDEHGGAHFRLRRLASRRDYAAVVEALDERFPSVAAAIATGDHEAMHTAIDQFDAPSSSKERFWRFVRDAQREATGVTLPRLAFSPTPRAQRPQGRSSADDPVARQCLEAELAAYQGALPELLSVRDLDGATRVSDRLRALRAELRDTAAGSP